MYRVALLGSNASRVQATSGSSSEQRDQGPPIAEGDQRTVDIKDIGKQGDGTARVECGYVIIVPETGISDRVTVEIRHVQENLAFSDVIEHVDPAHFE